MDVGNDLCQLLKRIFKFKVDNINWKEMLNRCHYLIPNLNNNFRERLGKVCLDIPKMNNDVKKLNSWTVSREIKSVCNQCLSFKKNNNIKDVLMAHLLK